MAILAFFGANRCFSNFFNAPVLWGDEYTPARIWDNNEIPFQLAKSVSLEERARFIKTVEDAPLERRAAIAKKLGGRHGILTMRADWEENDGALKRRVMEELVFDKFSRTPELKARLLATGDQKMIEGNQHGDRYWGQVNGYGRNELGKILERVRESLRT